MKKANVIIVGLSVLLLIILTAFGAKQTRARGLRLNTKDLRDQGLIIIAPTDPAFDSELAKLQSAQSLTVTQRAFSILVKNVSPREVIAYRLRWDLLHADGTVTTHLRTYAEPGALMGRSFNGSCHVSGEGGLLLRANSVRYISLFPVPSSVGAGGIESSTGGANGQVELAEIHARPAESQVKALTDLLASQLVNSDSLTITLDAAVFDNGEFLGPDGSKYFEQIEAEVDAKKEILRNVLSAAQSGVPMEQIFQEVESIRKEHDASKRNTISDQSTPEDYYNFYRKAFAEELLSMKTANKNDRFTVWQATRPLYRYWPKLHKR